MLTAKPILSVNAPNKALKPISKNVESPVTSPTAFPLDSGG